MWILELCGVMANTHTNMGKTHEEAEKLQNDHKKFESTAQVSQHVLMGLYFAKISNLYTSLYCKFRNYCVHLLL